MISGRKTLSSIENAISEVQRSLQRIQSELKTANDEKAKLLKQRIAALRELAECKVRAALYDDIIDETDNLTHQVSALLRARSKTIATIKVQLKTAREEHSKLLLSHEKLLKEIDEGERNLDDVADKAEAELASYRDYASVKKQYDDLQAIYEKAGIKTRQAEEDRDEKGESYRSDVLFMYLWKRKYGTKAYFANTNRVIELLDKWVADLVNYYGTKENYAVLLQIPERLNDHLERLEVQIAELQEKLSGLKVDKITEMAGSDLTGALKNFRSKEVELNAQLQQSDAEISDVIAQLNHFIEGQDYSFKKAVRLAAEALEHENISDLLHEARQTDDPQDDKILERLRNIDKEIDQLDENIVDQKDDLRRLFKRKQELVGLSANFRRNHYDDPGSEFSDNSNLNAMLGELMKGAITAAEYWARAQRNHSWRSRSADPFRHSSHLPPFGGSMETPRYEPDNFDSFDDFGDDFGDEDFRTGGGF